MINTILFDLDGTLADTAADLGNALNAIRAEQNLPPITHDIIRPTVSAGSEAMIKLAFGLQKGDAGFAEIRAEFLERYLKNIAQETRLFDGIAEVINTIETENKIWGIVTNKSTRLTEPLLQKLALDHRVDCVVCGDTLTRRKPHPAPILHACRLTNSSPESTVYIGDTQRDIEAGHRAGAKTLVALYGYIDKNEDPGSWLADGMVASPGEISDKLLAMDH